MEVKAFHICKLYFFWLSKRIVIKQRHAIRAIITFSLLLLSTMAFQTRIGGWWSQGFHRIHMRDSVHANLTFLAFEMQLFKLLQTKNRD